MAQQQTKPIEVLHRMKSALKQNHMALSQSVKVEKQEYDKFNRNFHLEYDPEVHTEEGSRGVEEHNKGLEFDHLSRQTEGSETLLKNIRLIAHFDPRKMNGEQYCESVRAAIDMLMSPPALLPPGKLAREWSHTVGTYSDVREGLLHIRATYLATVPPPQMSYAIPKELKIENVTAKESRRQFIKNLAAATAFVLTGTSLSNMVSPLTNPTSAPAAADSPPPAAGFDLSKEIATGNIGDPSPQLSNAANEHFSNLKWKIDRGDVPAVARYLTNPAFANGDTYGPMIAKTCAYMLSLDDKAADKERMLETVIREIPYARKTNYLVNAVTWTINDGTETQTPTQASIPLTMLASMGYTRSGPDDFFDSGTVIIPPNDIMAQHLVNFIQRLQAYENKRVR